MAKAFYHYAQALCCPEIDDAETLESSRRGFANLLRGVDKAAIIDANRVCLTFDDHTRAYLSLRLACATPAEQMGLCRRIADGAELLDGMMQNSPYMEAAEEGGFFDTGLNLTVTMLSAMRAMGSVIFAAMAYRNENNKKLGLVLDRGENVLIERLATHVVSSPSPA
jgi:hypothetical protein